MTKQEKERIYDKIVEASTRNLVNFTKENHRKSFYIPSQDYRKMLYDIEISKIVTILGITNVNTITMSINSFKDLKFFLKQKLKLRKTMCKLKLAKKEDINIDIITYTTFMNNAFKIENNSIYKDIYDTYFNTKELKK